MSDRVNTMIDPTAIPTEERATTRSLSTQPKSAFRSPLVLSEIFPPTKGGSGKWLSEIYARLSCISCLMVVGKNNHAADGFDDHLYPHPIARENLSMAFRGLAQWPSILAYHRISKRVTQLATMHRTTEIHASRPLFEGLVARWLKWRSAIPYLCFVHGEDINIARTSRELSLLTTSVLKHADKLIANSNFTRDLLLNDWNIPTERIELMHPGVDCRYFCPPSTPPQRSLFPASSQVLLTVGRLQERKGHDTLIRGLVEIRKVSPNVLYAIVGDGEQRPLLQQMASRLGLENHVLFLGEVDDETLRDAYRECDLFVLPNRSVGRDVEGFGIVLLEAQACGKAVIAGKSGGTKDAIADKEGGFLIDCQNPNDPAALVAAICRLLADSRQREVMGRKARTFVQNSFDWDALAKQAQRVLSVRSTLLEVS